MLNPNYRLEIVSHLPEFKNRSMKKYHVEGIDTVGVWGNEPFEIRFTNNTYSKIQVKLSIDGTDILNGDVANTEPNKEMWVVNGYGTLNIKAWPESHNGGAQFIFSNANNSVAVNTHGDMSSRGIIAAAVFVESHVTTPVFIYNNDWWPKYPKYEPYSWRDTHFLGSYNGGGGTYTSNNISTKSMNSIPTMEGAAYNCSFNSAQCNTNENFSEPGATMDSLVAVGAGQYVEQKITHVAGLIKPSFSETVRVRYLWWDELQSKLKEHRVAEPHGSGFPGDKKTGINLGSTPRIGTPERTQATSVGYARF